MARRAKKRTGGPSYEEVWADIEERESKKPLTKKQQEQERRKKLRLESLEQDKKIGAKESKGLLKADDSSIKKIHGTISKLAGHVRKAVIRIGSLEKRSDKIEGRADKIEEKTSKIVNILKSQKSKIGEKIPGSSRDSLNKTLIETNKILVDIQKQLTLQSKNEEKQQKEKSRKDSISESRKRLKAEESLLEKTSKGIGKVIGKVASKSLEPIKNIFDKIMSFIALIGAGIATNATLEWFKDEENRKKLTKFFNILKENWQLLAKILGTLAIGALALKIIAVAKTIMSALALLASPAGLAVIGGVLLAMGAEKAGDHFRKLKEKRSLQQEVSLGIKDSSKIGGDDGMSFEEYKIFNYMEPGFEGLQDATVDPRIERNKQRLEEVMSDDFNIMDETPTIIQREKTFGERFGDFFRPAQKFIYGGERAMGGPVTAGQSYLVGERGPEIFSPNINGSIVNNMRTEKIVQTLSSDMGEGSINMIELPPITNQMPPPEIPLPAQQATDVPEISSTNMADPYRQLSPLLYGITV